MYDMFSQYYSCDIPKFTICLCEMKHYIPRFHHVGLSEHGPPIPGRIIIIPFKISVFGDTPSSDKRRPKMGLSEN